MNPYAISLAIGATGTAVMALRGLGLHAGHGHDSGSHVGHAHGHGDGGHADGHGHGGHGHAAHGHGGHGHGEHGHAAAKLDGSKLLSLLSPRVWFSLLTGFGAAGFLGARFLGGVPLFALAVAGGIVFERLLVRPLWNLMLRFESAPAATLEAAILDEAVAITDFDRDGRGMVSLDLDGRTVQVLGSLSSGDRALGVRIRRGSRVRIDDVDPGRNRCVVSLISGMNGGENA